MSDQPARREARCTNQACTEANGHSASICNHTGDGSRCTALITTECPRVVGPFEQDDAVIVASFDGLWNSIELATTEINVFGLGLG